MGRMGSDKPHLSDAFCLFLSVHHRNHQDRIRQVQLHSSHLKSLLWTTESQTLVFGINFAGGFWWSALFGAHRPDFAKPLFLLWVMNVEWAPVTVISTRGLHKLPMFPPVSMGPFAFSCHRKRKLLPSSSSWVYQHLSTPPQTCVGEQLISVLVMIILQLRALS